MKKKVRGHVLRQRQIAEGLIKELFQNLLGFDYFQFKVMFIPEWPVWGSLSLAPTILCIYILSVSMCI